ncbi:putative MYND finger protein [Lyophyllum shimeji]|uniref:MYND finger protein n=1 Tax=Lyophyllum shimeji TaxID=47721 RepID=A0A9P3PC89_LYOSH|nr:putative MYND finger protein [Lyophyllum shimeji]
MTVTCYFCNKDLPNSQMKHCARCLLVTYCSKECQTLSWKASHKQSCRIHPSFAPSTDPKTVNGRWSFGRRNSRHSGLVLHA